MIMIPLPYLFGALLIGLAIWARRFWDANPWLTLYLAWFAMQEILIGTRFGYGFGALALIQPITAAVIPPLAYLAFRAPKLDLQLLRFTLPVLIILAALIWNRFAVDALLALNNLVFAVALIFLACRGAEALSWAPFQFIPPLHLLLWLSVLNLLVSGAVDGLITLDFLLGDGSNLTRIVSYAALGAIAVATIAIALWRFLPRVRVSETPSETEPTFKTVTQLLEETKLYLDPDLTLSRLARRAGLPQRIVSQSINAHAGENVSQYINRLRIGYATELLAKGKPVTDAIYTAGFNTKSNFNREFLRITGKTPTQWRRNHAD